MVHGHEAKLYRIYRTVNRIETAHHAQIVHQQGALHRHVVTARRESARYQQVVADVKVGYGAGVCRNCACFLVGILVV